MKKLDRLDVVTIIVTVFAVALISYFTAVDLQRFVVRGELLSILRLSNWSVLASGSIYVLSYPTACALSNMSASTTGSVNQSKAVLIACPSASYVAIVTDGDYYVSCNATEAYKGWGLVDKYYGYIYVYEGVKALSCTEISASSLQSYLLGCEGCEGGRIPAMYWGAYGKIIIDSWTSEAA